MRLSLNTLQSRAAAAQALYQSCQLCPHRCQVDRTAGETGLCGQSDQLKIAAAVPHYGEEPPLGGITGVGNIFLTGCSMSCVYCQNFQASQLNFGEIVTPAIIAEYMMNFQKQGLPSVGWVTPAHFTPGLIQSAYLAASQGFHLPLIYNTSSFENVETLKLFDRIIDIYLADLRYSDSVIARKYSKIEEYTKIAQSAVEEMFRQVGAFKEDVNKMKGLIIRLLVLPDNLAGLWETLCFIALELSRKIPLSLMSQYQPMNTAGLYPEIDRFITNQEYSQALKMAQELGFDTIYTQPLNHLMHRLPDFTRKDQPFGNWK